MQTNQALFSGEVEAIIGLSEEQIKRLSNSVLLDQTQLLVQAERRIGVGVLNRLKEIDARKIYLDLGYSTLFKYMVHALKYPESNAFRLMQAVNVIKVLPDVEKKIESGALSVTSISQAKSYINAQSKENGIKFTLDEQKKIFESIEGQATRNVEKTLASLHPDKPLKAPEEKTRTINKDQTLIQFIASDELIELFNRVKDLDAHRNWNPSHAELFQMLANFYLDKKDPLRKVKKEPKQDNEPEACKDALGEKPQAKAEDTNEMAAQSTTVPQNQANVLSALKANKQSRYIRVADRRQVARESQGRCTFISKITGRRCNETRGLQFEHCLPWALGGSNDAQNLVQLCGRHNRWASEKIFGRFVRNAPRTG